MKRAREIALNDQINRRISVDAINRKSTSREKAKFPVKIEVFKDGVKHAYRLVKKLENRSQNNRDLNLQSAAEIMQQVNSIPIVVTRVSSHKGRTDQKTTDFVGSDYVQNTKVVRDARKAAIKQRLARNTVSKENKTGNRMLISDSESFERSSRSDNKGSYHKWSKSSVVISSPKNKAKDFKGSPKVNTSVDSSKNDT